MRVALAAARERPEPFARGPLWEHLVHRRTFATVEKWPDRVESFADIAFLFSSNLLNMGIALLSFDEAAYLYRLVRSLGPATIVEIGRFKGGSTLLMATAMDRGARLISYDLHLPMVRDVYGPEQDALLRTALARYGVDDRVELVVGDSTSAAPKQEYDLVFVDGDHTYEGARADYDVWGNALRVGGHLLYHDAVQRPFLSYEPGVARLVMEIEREEASRFERLACAGSLVHFTRIQ